MCFIHILLPISILEHVCLSVYVLRELFAKGYIVCGEEVNLNVKWGRSGDELLQQSLCFYGKV